MCVTLSSKVNRQSHVIVFNIFDSLDLIKMLESTPRSTSYHVCNRRYERLCKKVFDLDFQGHAIDRICSLSPLDSLTPKTHPRDIFSKISDGVASTPLGRFRLAKYLGRLMVIILAYSQTMSY